AEVAARLSCPISPLASRWGIEIAVTSVKRGAERVAALCSGDELSSPRSLPCLLDCLALPRVVVMRSEESRTYVYFSLGARWARILAKGQRPWAEHKQWDPER
ncbi:unnamed protein product, partial [Ectocarpus sp. 12 AP-2014]